MEIENLSNSDSDSNSSIDLPTPVYINPQLHHQFLSSYHSKRDLVRSIGLLESFISQSFSRIKNELNRTNVSLDQIKNDLVEPVLKEINAFLENCGLENQIIELVP